MIRVALKGIAERRFRGVLTALAIVLGVAMVSGAFVLADTMRAGADSLSTASYKGTDAVVDARTAFDVDAAEGGRRRPSPPRCWIACAGARGRRRRGRRHRPEHPDRRQDGKVVGTAPTSVSATTPARRAPSGCRRSA